MLSRLTSACKRSSLHPEVPAGRRGMTMYRRSAVLSCTRIVMLEGTSVPNSESTLLGSITTRARYDLSKRVEYGDKEYVGCGVSIIINALKFGRIKIYMNIHIHMASYSKAISRGLTSTCTKVGKGLGLPGDSSCRGYRR